MNYVYILQSVSHPDQFYTGLCKDVAARLSSHNAGQSPIPPSSSRGGYCPVTISNDQRRLPLSSATLSPVPVAHSPTSGSAEGLSK
jgi:hypothetical protein